MLVDAHQGCDCKTEQERYTSRVLELVLIDNHSLTLFVLTQILQTTERFI